MRDRAPKSPLKSRRMSGKDALICVRRVGIVGEDAQSGKAVRVAVVRQADRPATTQERPRGPRHDASLVSRMAREEIDRDMGSDLGRCGQSRAHRCASARGPGSTELPPQRSTPAVHILRLVGFVERLELGRAGVEIGPEPRDQDHCERAVKGRPRSPSPISSQ